MRHSGAPASAFGPKYQAQIAAQTGGKLPPQGSHPLHEPHNDTAAGAGPAVRQRQGPALNKTEQAFLDHLRASPEGEGRDILVQDLTLRLANGTRYTPDFFLPPVWRGKVHHGIWPIAYEVKGFMRDDARVKLTVAARAFPWIRFYLVSRKGRAHPWRVQEIKP